jgi:hypothetical protein
MASPPLLDLVELAEAALTSLRRFLAHRLQLPDGGDPSRPVLGIAGISLKISICSSRVSAGVDSRKDGFSLC